MSPRVKMCKKFGRRPPNLRPRQSGSAHCASVENQQGRFSSVLIFNAFKKLRS
jgi:hypothetical protein